MTVSFSEIEQLARTLRTQLGNTGIYKISLDAVISGCKDLNRNLAKAKAIERRGKITPILEIAEKLTEKGEYESNARDLIRLYDRALIEYIKKN